MIRGNESRFHLTSRPWTGAFLAIALLAGMPALAAVELNSAFTAPPDYTPGLRGTWAIVVENTGTDAETDLRVETSFPAGATVTAASCTTTGEGTICDATVDNNDELQTQPNEIAAGGSITWLLTVDYDMGLDDDPLRAQAFIQSSNGSENLDAQADFDETPTADVSVDKTTDDPDYVPGSNGEFTVTVANAAAPDRSDALDVNLVDEAPTGMTIGNWSCDASLAARSICPPDGNGDLTAEDETFDLATGDSLEFTLEVFYEEDADADPLVNTARVSIDSSVDDINNGNDESSAAVPLAQADLSVAFNDDNPTTYTPGGTADNGFGSVLGLVVANGGPSDVDDATLQLTLPVEVSEARLRCEPLEACSPVSGTGNISTVVSAAADTSVNIVLELDFASDALADPLELQAEVTSATPDDDSSNNSRTASLGISRQAKLEVSKTDGLDIVGPGQTFDYQITVKNLGPSDIGNAPDDSGVLVSDTFDQQLLGDPADPAECGDTARPCSEVCPSDNGEPGQYDPGNCPNGVDVETILGNISNQQLRLSAGSSTIIRSYVRLSSSAADDTVLTNTVTAEIATSDLVLDLAPGASASDTTDVVIATDVVVHKYDGDNKDNSQKSAVAGESHTYTVLVENTGGQAVDGVRVEDVFPIHGDTIEAGFVAGSVEWQCSATNSACCNSGTSQCGLAGATDPVSENALDQLVDLPGKSSVEFTITGTLAPEATGTLSNTATATLPEEVDDSRPENNTDSDEDTEVVSEAALSITKELEDDDEENESAPFELKYRIEISNAGPSVAAGVEVEDLLNDVNLDASTATWVCMVAANPDANTSCDAAAGSGALNATADIGIDGTIAFEVDVTTTDDAEGEITNEATATFNGKTERASISSSLSATADLSITNTDNIDDPNTATPGTEHRYTIEVRNSGDPVFGAKVEDQFPPELENVAWSCEATTPIPGDLSFIQSAGPSTSAARRLVDSPDGNHAYQLIPDANRILVYQRNNVPGEGFGSMVAIGFETNGENTVQNMENPVDIAMSPDGRHVYVLSHPAADSETASVPAITVFGRETNPASGDFGTLSFNGAVSEEIPALPRRLGVSIDNVFVTGGTGELKIYQRSAGSGLAEFLESAQSTDVPVDPGPVAIDRAANLLFVAATSGSDLAMFSINTDDSMGTPIGRLSLLDTSNDAALDSAADMVLFADRENDQGDLYLAAERANSIAAVEYGDADDDGNRAFGDVVSEQVDTPSAVDIAPDGEHVLAVSAANNRVHYFRRDLNSGLLREGMSLPSDEDNPVDIDVTSDGRHLLVSSLNGKMDSDRPLAVYARRAPDPRFAFIETDLEYDVPGDGLLSPTDVVVSPDGATVYTVNLGNGALTAFDRNADATTGGGHLTHRNTWFNGIGGVSGMSEPEYVLVSPDNKSVVVSSERGNSIAIFKRAENGDLAFVEAHFNGDLSDGSEIVGLGGARGLAMDDTSTHLYVAGGFDDAVAVFQRRPAAEDGSLSGSFVYVGAANGGDSSFAGLDGVRDVTVGPDGDQVFAVADTDDSLVVFDRESDVTEPDFGLLRQRQLARIGVGDRPMAVAASPDGDHVYLVAQNTDSISLFRRVTDPASSNFGEVVFENRQFDDGTDSSSPIEFMNGPRDIEVSPDGKRVYVAAQFDSALLAFDRDLNSGSEGYGELSLIETRRDGVDGVEGLDNIYALAVNALNVYTAGFDDRAVSSFVLGIGSVCTAGGSGAIDDTVVIGNGGTLEYRVTGDIRPDAIGVLSNTASVSLPARVDDPDETNNSDDDETTLVPRADLAVVKTNEQVSVTAGEPVTYDIEITNLGPSNLANGADFPVTVSDLFADNPDFEPDSVTWSCTASSSGALTFGNSIIEETPVEGEPAPPDLGLEGVADLVPVPDPDGDGPLPAMLASASVIDDALALFARDPVDGALTFLTRVADGETLAGEPVTGLAGARAVAASSDGRFIYVASRTDDALSVFSIADDGSGNPQLFVEQTIDGFTGLDQAADIVLSADGASLYVAGTNDDAVALFARDTTTGLLSFVESERDGVDDVGDIGGVVSGLDGVEALLLSADGAHLYAISATARAIARFDIDADSGEMSWAAEQTANALDVDLSGAAAGALSADGRHVYVASSAADRIIALARDNDPGSTDYGRLTTVSETIQGVDRVTGLLSPRGIAISADGLHVYVTGQTSDAVTWFLRDPDNGSLRFGGVLSNQSSFVNGLDGASGLAIDDDLGRVYVAGTLQAGIAWFARSNDSICPVSGTGELDAIPIDIAVGGSVNFEVTATVAADAAGEVENFVSVSTPPGTDPEPDNDSGEDTDVVQVTADLSITKDDGRAEFDGLAGVSALVGTRTSLYTAGTDDDSIGVFSRIDDPGTEAHGRINFEGVITDGQSEVNALALSGDRLHLYSVSPVDSSLVVLDRDPGDGSLAFAEVESNGVLGVTGIGGAIDVAVSPDDEHVYVVGELENSIAAFDRDADPGSENFGEVTFLGAQQNGTNGVNNLTGPVALAVSPDGRSVYAVSPDDQSIVAFERNISTGSSQFGTLGFVASYSNGGSIAGLAGATDVVVSEDGAWVWVLGADEGTLALFSRDVTTGELAFVEFKQDGTGGTTGLAGASRMRLSPDGAHLYVAAAAADGVVRFDVAADGTLDFTAIIANGDPAPLTGGSVLGLDGARDVWLPGDGDQLYAVSETDNALVTFEREHTAVPETNTGALDFRDLLIDGLGGVAPGETVVYTIVVENNGPSDVADATVVDDFPDKFSSISWTCSPTASPAGECTPSGSGSINDEAVSLEAGARVTYQASAVVREDASGRLVNTATVTGRGVTDPVIANNSATDDDTVLSPRINLVVDLDNGQTEATPGAPVTYTATVDNIGPSFARDVAVTDAIPPAMFDVSWSCQAFPVEGLLSPAQALGTPLSTSTALIVTGDGRFAYGAGIAGGTPAIVAFQRDSVTGGLSPLETLREGGEGTQAIRGGNDFVLGGGDRFLYLAASESDSISVFERDDESGLLTPLAVYRDGEFGVDGLGGVGELAFGPNNRFLYAAGTLDDAIAIFAVNGDGTLSFTGQVNQGDSGVDGLNGVVSMAWSQGYLLVAAADNNSLSVFEHDASTGALAPAAVILNSAFGPPDPAPELDRPSDVIAIGERVLVAAAGGNSVTEFDFDPAREPVLERIGTITNGTDGLAEMVEPIALAYAENQQRLYVASEGSEQVHLFGLDGPEPRLLGQYSGSELPALAGLNGVFLPSAGGALYAMSDTSGIGVFGRQRGSLCPLDGELELGGHSAEIAPGGVLEYTISGMLFANATDSLVYRVEANSAFAERELDPEDNYDEDIDTMVPAPDLVVSKTNGLEEVVAGTGIAWNIDLSNKGPSDALAALFTDAPPIHPEDPGLVSGSATWSCSANDPLSPAYALSETDLSVLAGAAVVEASADGRRLVVASPELDSVSIFSVAADGSLVLETTLEDGAALGADAIAGLAGASAVAETRDGRHLFVAGRDANSLAVFERNDAGAYRFVDVFTSGVSGVSGMIGPADIALTPDEDFVYVAASTSDSIAVFERSGGTLTFVERVRDGFGTIEPDSDVIRGVRRLQIGNGGERLYAVSPGSGAVATFAVDGASGRLEYIEVLRHGEGGVTGLSEAWDVAAPPGLEQLYVADRAGGITVLEPGADGTLTQTASLTGIPGMEAPGAIVSDNAGSRLYVTDGNGSLHLLARDWSNGELDQRGVFEAADSVPASPVALAYAPSPAGVFVAAPEPGEIARFDELALSRCLDADGGGLGGAGLEGDSDAVELQIDFGVGGYGAVGYNAMVDPAARGELVNTASLFPTIGADLVDGDNSDSDSTTVIAVSDIAVDKSGPAQAVAGTLISYEILVTNTGPSDALGIMVTDNAPAALTQVEWTCSATVESECPAAGDGAPDFAATVRVDGELVVTVTALIDPSFIGFMTNEAVLTPEPGADDPTTDDHADSVETEVIAVADVAVGKTTLTQPVIAGQPVEYRLEAVNLGPSDATGVRLVDEFPASIAGADWTCSASGGADCPASGAGSIDTMIPMPVDSSVEFIVTGELGPEEVGELSNRITATVAEPATDPDAANDSVRVDDVIEVWADVSISLRAGINPFDPAGPNDLPLELLVGNIGPSNARNVDVLVNFSAPVTRTSDGCTQPAPDQVRCLVSQLDPGGSRSLDVALADLPAAPGSLEIDVVVTSSADNDPVLDNNVDALVVELRSGIDLSVDLDNGMDQMAPGEQVQYAITVDNYGSVDAVDAVVEVDLPPQLLNIEWTCQPVGDAGCSAQGLDAIADTVSIASGARVVYTVDAEVDPGLDPDVPQTITVTALAETDPAADDYNADNNLAVDQDGIGSLIFKDGFEPAQAAAMRVMETEDQACFSVETGLERGETSSARVLKSSTADGRDLFWIERARAGGKYWIQLSTIGDREASVSGWIPMASGDEAVEVRVENDIPSLHLGNAAVWRADAALPGSTHEIHTLAGTAASACSGEGQGSGQGKTMETTR